MKHVLLDTHAFLWFVFDDPRLSSRAASLINRSDVEKTLSIASVWEIVIKEQLGKLQLGMSIGKFVRDFIDGRELTLLDIELSHLLEYSSLPLTHRDPFDRLLVAQARSLGIPIVTADKKLSSYGVKLLW